MTESSDTSDKPDKPQDFANLRAELAKVTDEFAPATNELWPRLEDHKYRWELHGYGLPDVYDKLVVSDIIALLNDALKAMSIAGNKLMHATLKAADHTPTDPALDQYA